MAEVNELILEKLRKYPPKVAKVASEAVRAAANLPERAVVEHLQGVIRREVREKGSKT